MRLSSNKLRVRARYMERYHREMTLAFMDEAISRLMGYEPDPEPDRPDLKDLTAGEVVV
jgi:hypothetical protein